MPSLGAFYYQRPKTRPGRFLVLFFAASGFLLSSGGRTRLADRWPSGREVAFVGTSRVEFWVSDNKKHQGWASETSYLSISGISGGVGPIPWTLEPFRKKSSSSVDMSQNPQDHPHSKIPRTTCDSKTVFIICVPYGTHGTKLCTISGHPRKLCTIKLCTISAGILGEGGADEGRWA